MRPRHPFLPVSAYHPALRDWHVPLWEDQLTLQEAYDSLLAVGNQANEVPLIVRLTENPEFHLGGLGFFKGRVTLEQHDCIHILLGRGARLMDEAFVIGFTMGSTDRVSTEEASIFSFISSTLYPKAYRFDAQQIQVFKDAVALGYVSDCTPLDTVDFRPFFPQRLSAIRAALHLEVDLLEAYYRIEARRHPGRRSSQRLLRPGGSAA